VYVSRHAKAILLIGLWCGSVGAFLLGTFFEAGWPSFERATAVLFIGLGVACFVLMVLPSPREHPPGHCRACGYDLTLNQSGRCPECGLNHRAAPPAPIGTNSHAKPE